MGNQLQKNQAKPMRGQNQNRKMEKNMSDKENDPIGYNSIQKDYNFEGKRNSNIEFQPSPIHDFSQITESEKQGYSQGVEESRSIQSRFMNSSDIFKSSLNSRTDNNIQNKIVQSRLNSLPGLNIKLKSQMSAFTIDNSLSFCEVELQNKIKGKYVGQLINDKAAGAGKLYLHNNDYLEGQFEDGRVNGNGRYIKADGSYYEGQFKNNQADGYGKYEDYSGYKYEGMWKNNMPNGQGEAVYHDQGRYIGQFFNGKRNGTGNYMTNQDTYEGQFFNNKIHGFCTFYGANGEKYIGQWKNGLKQGKGVYEWSNGMNYEGQYKNNVRQGFGIMKYLNHQTYSGLWKNGKKHGEGKFTSLKQQISGFWVNGQLKKILE